jgi:hypothetical protein
MVPVSLLWMMAPPRLAIVHLGLTTAFKRIEDNAGSSPYLRPKGETRGRSRPEVPL